MKHAFMLGLLSGMGLAALAQGRTIDLENARELDLDGLRGLGPASTRQILEERERRPFKDWQDLMQRSSGIGPRKAAQLSAQGLRVQGQPYPAAAPPR
ncbi:MAG: ComEA family DNA-binding protein [Limnohabitans sp.]